jgi:GTP pyrophosphokinase
VSGLVDGLTKISSLTFRSSAEQQVENYRKLLLSIAKDARVIIIKLADRLHNMRTLDPLPPEKRVRIATETREIYAPLAHRFGMASIKAELEDLAFKYLEPEDYKTLVQQVAAKKTAREQLILKLKTPLEYELKRAGIEWFEVTGRPKHLWSIYQKMKKRGKPFDEIYDLMAIRVMVRTVPECYHVLGIIHHNWTPIQERIKDYIASPKTNAYQSLHTTIFGPGGQLFEVQIRTQEMHRTAEFGIAAHWLYKTDGRRNELGPAAPLVPPADRAAAGCPHAGGVPRVPQDRPVPGRDLRVHAAGRREAAPQGRNTDRFRLHGAHRGRRSLSGCQGQRSHRALAPGAA